MPRRSLLLLFPIGFFLIVAPLGKADSVKNLPQLDSGQLFSLYGSDYRGQFVLTPDSILHLCRGSSGCGFNRAFNFAFSTPVGWAGGDVKYAFSFGDELISGEFPNVSPCSPPNVPCFGFGVSGINDVGLMTPASWRLSFLGANGGTETVNFFVSDATPEPQTLLLFGTGSVLLGVIYRRRIRSAKRIAWSYPAAREFCSRPQGYHAVWSEEIEKRVRDR